ncbi:probable E3 ubiquitin-protein ligase ari8 [Phtheirospermum japonicum]|uniref:RBR-type E3 ubiquitin transferase n=1 Tax=Phtheirospermum japonicum TaxID=374723 RepID=A0A830BPR2_9LAMI|nr:probable E3 ubiquitin-protein ligase ari8 [Phtheirospermum japonicum]
MEEIDVGPQKRYKIVQEDEIRQLQEKYISDVSNVISVSRSVACTLLCQSNWVRSSVYDKWFSSDEGNRDPQPVNTQNSFSSQICKICCETITTEKNMLSGACGHLFCVDCWRAYITTSIKDGPGCLTLPCLELGCKSHPGLDMVDSLFSGDDKGMYYRHLYRSYVETNPQKIKWCPAPGCDFAIEFDAGCGDGTSYEATCDCGYKMCFNCGEESHSPLDCQTVSKWMEKNNSEAENTAWILAYTKPCPKCRKAIEKNQGCNHMTCRQPCGFQFCWICLGGWFRHDYIHCNMYRGKGGSPDDVSRTNAKKHLERYTHYYERWDTNDKSRKRALADLNTRATQAELKCVVEAWEQIVECRRVLKWSYAYGYYVSESESGKLDFFGHLLGEAENALERLHHCAEKEMDKYLSAECVSEDFQAFRTKLTDLTSVTKKYFENLVRAWENDLCGAADNVESESTESSRKRKDRKD